jgi:hypothetical protein
MRQQLKTKDSNLGSYLYQQYSDDDDLQAFVSAQNDAQQTFLDWFNSISLPDYTGLSGDLLAWVAEGLYGQTKTQLASPTTPAVGMLNTEILNTEVLNFYSPSTQTFYNITDDVFQRILTWNFYKGDGKRFSIRWLKRRIIRFLVGANGIDPQPYRVSSDGTRSSNPAFTIGAETLQSVGVVIAGGTVTVSVDQSLLSLQTDLAPNILQLFKLAFEGGQLDLPIQFGYVVNIITGFNVIVRPSVVSITGSASTLTTPAALAITLGGTGIYTYLWAWATGGLSAAAAVGSAATGSLTAGTPAFRGSAVAGSTATGALTAPAVGAITIDTSTAVSTTFTASGLAQGEIRTGTAIVTVTDTVSGRTATATVLVMITRTAANLYTSEDGLILTTEDGNPLALET